MPSPDTRLKHLVAVLKGRRCRLTPQRLAILAQVARSEGHPSIEEIYERLKGAFPTMSIATVYKTVTLLKELGEVLELSFPEEGVKRYDGATPYPHPHIICVRCRKILDPEIGNLTPLVETAGRLTGFRILSHRLDLYGLCPDCQAREQEAG
ncbi:MAG: Fur family transcriptional regulator [Desulfobaccales bacterium]